MSIISGQQNVAIVAAAMAMLQLAAASHRKAPPTSPRRSGRRPPAITTPDRATSTAASDEVRRRHDGHPNDDHEDGRRQRRPDVDEDDGPQPGDAGGLDRPRSAHPEPTGLAAGEEHQHCHHPTVDIGSVVETELDEDRRAVLLDGVRTDTERLGDCRIRSPGRHLGQHVELTRREGVQWRVDHPRSCSDECVDDLVVDERPSGGDDPDRLGETVDLVDSILQHVAAATSAVVEQGEGVRRIDELGKHDDPHLGSRRSKASGSLDPLVTVVGWHADVGDDDIRFVALDSLVELVQACCRQSSGRDHRPPRAGSPEPSRTRRLSSATTSRSSSAIHERRYQCDTATVRGLAPA